MDAPDHYVELLLLFDLSRSNETVPGCSWGVYIIHTNSLSEVFDLAVKRCDLLLQGLQLHLVGKWVLRWLLLAHLGCRFYVLHQFVKTFLVDSLIVLLVLVLGQLGIKFGLFHNQESLLSCELRLLRPFFQATNNQFVANDLLYQLIVHL